MWWRGRGRRWPLDPDEGALWWATLRQNDPAGFRADRTGFEAWVQVPAHAAAWARMATPIARVGDFASMPELCELRRAALDATWRSPTETAYRRARRGLVAASVLLLAVWIGLPAGPWDGAGTASLVQGLPERHVTQVGERREVVLEDGSRISLNTASVIEILYTRERRDVRLVDGQALFHVAKDAARPFVVAAGDRLITAIGTTFDVRVRRGGEVDVMLVEGRVNVDPVRPVGLARLVPALGRERLVAGRHLQVAPGQPLSVAVGDGDRTTAWERGLLIFRSDRIADAVAEINRYSRTPLLIEDARLLGLEVSGVFPTTGSEDFIAALQAFHPVEVRRGEGVTTLHWRAPVDASRTARRPIDANPVR